MAFSQPQPSLLQSGKEGWWLIFSGRRKHISSDSIQVFHDEHICILAYWFQRLIMLSPCHSSSLVIQKRRLSLMKRKRLIASIRIVVVVIFNLLCFLSTTGLHADNRQEFSAWISSLCEKLARVCLCCGDGGWAWLTFTLHKFYCL